jgi:hypothetical protein
MSFVNIGLSLAVATPVALAVWVACRQRQPPSTPDRGEPMVDVEIGATRACFKAETLELDAEVRAVAEWLAEEAADRYVSLQFAVNPGSRVHADWNALWMMLRSTMRTAIQATPGGHVLVTARPVGMEMYILVMDDGANASQSARESLAREASTLVALQGGSLAVEARRGRGTTITLRLPLPAISDAVGRDEIIEPTLAREIV